MLFIKFVYLSESQMKRITQITRIHTIFKGLSCRSALKPASRRGWRVVFLSGWGTIFNEKIQYPMSSKEYSRMKEKKKPKKPWTLDIACWILGVPKLSTLFF